jgi:outer membrane protein assembly factor BamB
VKGSVASQPVVIGGTVVVVTEEASVFKLDPSSGEAKLVMDLRGADNFSTLVVNSQLCAADGILYMHSLRPDKIYALDVASGSYKSLALETINAAPAVTSTSTVTVTVTVTDSITVTVTG